MLKMVVTGPGMVKKKPVLILICVVCCTFCLSARDNVPSQEGLSSGERRYSCFQFGLVPPLGTNGMKSGEFTNAVSVNMLAGISRNENAFVLSTVSSIVYNDAKGIQIAGFTNHFGNTGKGVAVAGIANVTANAYKGVQIGGIMNRSGAGSGGFMLGGVLNIAKGSFRGFQMAGIVNVAEAVKGVQFAALVNIADESDWPIGLINIIRTGRKGLGVTCDALGNLLVSFRSGGRYSYGILGVGYNFSVQGTGALTTEAGYGIHIPVCRWFEINNEFKVTTIGAASDVSWFNAGYLLAPSFVIGKHYNIFGGPGINYFSSVSADAAGILPDTSLWRHEVRGGIRQLYIGYQAGLQYIF